MGLPFTCISGVRRIDSHCKIGYRRESWWRGWFLPLIRRAPNLTRIMAKAPKRILLVEDERAYLHALDLKLRKAGYEVQAVNNGTEAFQLLKKEKYDLLILDIVMPDLNGYIILDDLKKRHVHLPVIVLSNLSQEEDKKKIASYGIKVFLEKANITIVEVIKKVHEEIGS